MNEFAIRTFMNGLEDIHVPLGICVALPLTIVWMYIRKRMNETNKRTQIVLAVIEKNPDVDIQELLLSGKNENISIFGTNTKTYTNFTKLGLTFCFM